MTDEWADEVGTAFTNPASSPSVRPTTEIPGRITTALPGSGQRGLACRSRHTTSP